MNLAEALPIEIKRVSEIITAYKDPELKGAGILAARIMQMDIEAAIKASVEGDVVQMLIAYNSLKGYEL